MQFHHLRCFVSPVLWQLKNIHHHGYWFLMTGSLPRVHPPSGWNCAQRRPKTWLKYGKGNGDGRYVCYVNFWWGHYMNNTKTNITAIQEFLSKNIGKELYFWNMSFKRTALSIWLICTTIQVWPVVPIRSKGSSFQRKGAMNYGEWNSNKNSARQRWRHDLQEQ